MVTRIRISLLLTLTLFSGALFAHLVHAQTWPNCGTPVVTTLEAINGDGSYASGALLPGVPEKHNSPATTLCEVNGVNEYVRVLNVRAVTLLDKTDCISGTSFCDVTTDITDDPRVTVCPETSFLASCLHIEIDQAWEQAGVAPADFPLNTPIDVTGFAFWDSDHWEIHPVASWSLHGTVSVCSGVDYSNDGRVDLFDLSIFALHYGSRIGQAMYGVSYDLDNNGSVDIQDLSIFALQYGKTC